MKSESVQESDSILESELLKECRSDQEDQNVSFKRSIKKHWLMVVLFLIFFIPHEVITFFILELSPVDWVTHFQIVLDGYAVFVFILILYHRDKIRSNFREFLRHNYMLFQAESYETLRDVYNQKTGFKWTDARNLYYFLPIIYSAVALVAIGFAIEFRFITWGNTTFEIEHWKVIFYVSTSIAIIWWNGWFGTTMIVDFSKTLNEIARLRKSIHLNYKSINLKGMPDLFKFMARTTRILFGISFPVFLIGIFYTFVYKNFQWGLFYMLIGGGYTAGVLFHFMASLHSLKKTIKDFKIDEKQMILERIDEKRNQYQNALIRSEKNVGILKELILLQDSLRNIDLILPTRRLPTSIFAYIIQLITPVFIIINIIAVQGDWVVFVASLFLFVLIYVLLTIFLFKIEK